MNEIGLPEFSSRFDAKMSWTIRSSIIYISDKSSSLVTTSALRYEQFYFLFSGYNIRNVLVPAFLRLVALIAILFKDTIDTKLSNTF